MASSASASASAPSSAGPSRALTWSRPPSQGACPSGRGGHSATQVGNLMLVFGGTFFDAGRFHYLNDLWALDVETLKWHRPALGGGGPGGRAPPCPGPRYGHSAVIVDWNVFVFGGKGEGGLLYNDLWCLNVDSWTWELMPTTSSPPSPRMGHAAAAVDGKLVVSMGWDSQRTCFADVWVYDRALFSWSRPKVAGLAPRARHGAACQYDESNARLVLMGGQAIDAEGHPHLLRDTQELDLRAMAWARSRCAGDLPTDRYMHASAVVGNVVVSFGGWRGPAAAAADEAAAKAERPKAGAAPSARDAAVQAAKLALTATLGASAAGSGAGAAGVEPALVELPFQAGMGFGDAPASAGATIVVPLAAHADTFLLDVSKRELEYVQPRVAGKAPGMRYGATACACGLQVLIFGGWEGGRALAELLVLDLAAMHAAPGGE
jgi:hypothetical protein